MNFVVNFGVNLSVSVSALVLISQPEMSVSINALALVYLTVNLALVMRVTLVELLCTIFKKSCF